jgi:hypothetical protein
MTFYGVFLKDCTRRRPFFSEICGAKRSVWLLPFFFNWAFLGTYRWASEMTIVDVFECGAKSLMRLLPLYLNLAFQGPYRWASEMWIVDLLNKKQKVRGGCCPCTSIGPFLGTSPMGQRLWSSLNAEKNVRGGCCPSTKFGPFRDLIVGLVKSIVDLLNNY